jgi:hypothetical protein
MGVPEAAVHKNELPLCDEGQIRTTRNIATMKTESEAKPVRHPTNGQLGTRILTPDTRHQGASLTWRERAEIAPLSH